MLSQVPGLDVLGQVTSVEEALQTGAQHAGGVAYDLNNLLTVIIGYTDLSLRRIGLEDSLRHNLEETRKAAERAACLIRQLRTSSRQPITAPKGSETILLVEDEDVVRALTRKILMEAGYYVLDVKSGEEAIRLGRDYGGPINLLLTDVVMPKTSGKEIAERFHALRPAAGVLFISGYTDDVNFIQKPFTWVGLSKRVREVLDLVNSSSESHRA